jgi:hypothetical protein
VLKFFLKAKREKIFFSGRSIFVLLLDFLGSIGMYNFFKSA